MTVYNFLSYTIYCASVFLLAVSLLHLLKYKKQISNLEFIGLFFPILIFLAFFLIKLQKLHFIDYILMKSLFIISYAYLNYKLTISFTRDIYNTAMKIESMFNSPQRHIVKAFQKDKNITYGELLKVPESMPIMISKDIVIMRVPYPFEHIMFRTWMKEGASFEEHLHPDCMEFVTVIKGELKCRINKSVTPSGEILIIPPNIEHHPYCDEYTELMVYFKKN